MEPENTEKIHAEVLKSLLPEEKKVLNKWRELETQQVYLIAKGNELDKQYTNLFVTKTAHLFIDHGDITELGSTNDNKKMLQALDLLVKARDNCTDSRDKFWVSISNDILKF